MENMKTKSAQLLQEYMALRADELNIQKMDLATASIHVALAARGAERLLLESLLALSKHVELLETAATPSFEKMTRHVHLDAVWDTEVLEAAGTEDPVVGELATTIGVHSQTGIIVGIDRKNRICKIRWTQNSIESQVTTHKFLRGLDFRDALAGSSPTYFSDMIWSSVGFNHWNVNEDVNNNE